MNKVNTYRESWRSRHPKLYRDRNRRDNRNYNKKYPERRSFTHKVHRLLKKGYIEKKPCQVCGSKVYVQACTLSNPYKPLWLCLSHNKEYHKTMREMGLN